MKLLFMTFVLCMLFALPSQAQVLGTCGTGDEATEQPKSTGTNDGMMISPVPLPGQQAIDFQLPAVVGDDIKNVKLSDYDGKWRVLCFFPAAFTFV
jgi:hypothetical protein